MFRRDAVGFADDDRLRGQGRAVRGLQLAGKLGVAVGQGALVLINEDVGQRDWALADLNLPTEVRSGWDFHGVGVAGRPHLGRRPARLGDAAQRQPRRQPGRSSRPGSRCRSTASIFADARQGWAVGELGAILATTDGGKTWTVQHRGGERRRHPLRPRPRHRRAAGDRWRPSGADDGYLATGVRVIAADPATRRCRAVPPNRCA